MGINVELAKKAEAIAKEIAQDNGMPEEMWELFLMQAYDILKECVSEDG